MEKLQTSINFFRYILKIEMLPIVNYQKPREIFRPEPFFNPLLYQNSWLESIGYIILSMPKICFLLL